MTIWCDGVGLSKLCTDSHCTEDYWWWDNLEGCKVPREWTISCSQLLPQRERRKSEAHSCCMVNNIFWCYNVSWQGMLLDFLLFSIYDMWQICCFLLMWLLFDLRFLLLICSIQDSHFIPTYQAFIAALFCLYFGSGEKTTEVLKAKRLVPLCWKHRHYRFISSPRRSDGVPCCLGIYLYVYMLYLMIGSSWQVCSLWANQESYHINSAFHLFRVCKLSAGWH